MNKNRKRTAATTADDEPKMRGPHAYYRPKDTTPVTLNLTKTGKVRLDELCIIHDKHRADVVENLVLEHGHRMRFA